MLAYGSLCHAQSHDQETSDTDDPYKAGVACFDQLDFTCAIDLLTAASYSTKPSQADRWCDIFTKLAESHLALGQQELAVEDFSKLLKGVSDFRISRPGTSPKILEALQEARRRISESLTKDVSSSEKNSFQKAKRKHPESVSNVALSVEVGAEFLSGQDKSLLDTGPVLSLELLHEYSHPWIIGGGIRWSIHGVSSSDDSIFILSAWAGGGLSVTLGSFRLYGLLCIGGGWFAITGGDGRGGLVIPLRLGAGWQISQNWGLGLAFTPSWILTFGDFLSSVTFDTSLAASVKF